MYGKEFGPGMDQRMTKVIQMNVVENHEDAPRTCQKRRIIAVFVIVVAARGRLSVVVAVDACSSDFCRIICLPFVSWKNRFSQ